MDGREAALAKTRPEGVSPALPACASERARAQRALCSLRGTQPDGEDGALCFAETANMTGQFPSISVANVVPGFLHWVWQWAKLSLPHVLTEKAYGDEDSVF